MKILKFAAVLIASVCIVTGCNGVQKDSEFGYSIQTPQGYKTTTAKDGFKMAFCPSENPDDVVINVKAEIIDDSILEQTKDSDDSNRETAKLLETKMADYVSGGDIVQAKGLTGYDGGYISAAADDADTPRTDVYYIVVNDKVYTFLVDCKNNDAAGQYQQDVLNLIGSIQIDGE